MTTVHPLPFGAETPDELLVAHANGSLSAAERAEVDRWLAAHPEWVARLRAYQAVAAAVRQGAATSAPPAIGAMSGLWASIDATPQPRPLRPAVPPPPAYLAAPPPRGGSRSPKWLLAVAASVVVAVGAVSVVLIQDRDGGELTIRDSEQQSAETTEAPATTQGDDAGAPPAPGSGGGSEAAQALRAGAESTSEQDTAHTTFLATATVDLAGTELADITNTESAIITVSGNGMVSFPDESVLDTATTFEGGLFEVLPEQNASTVTQGDDTYVSCEGEAYELEVEGQEGQCGALTFGTAFFGSDAGISLLDQALDDVETVGVEDIEGGSATHYQLEIDLADEGAEPEPATYDVWIGVDDGLIHQLTVTTSTSMPLEWTGTTYEIPLVLEMTYQLGQFGEPVEIPAVN